MLAKTFPGVLPKTSVSFKTCYPKDIKSCSITFWSGIYYVPYILKPKVGSAKKKSYKIKILNANFTLEPLYIGSNHLNGQLWKYNLHRQIQPSIWQQTAAVPALLDLHLLNKINRKPEVSGNCIISCFEVGKERKLRIGLTASHVENRHKYMINTLHFMLAVEFKGTIDFSRVCVVCISCNSLQSHK